MQNVMDVPVFQLLNSNTTGIDSPTILNTVTVYPNPAKDICNVQMESSKESAELKLIDLQGRIVFSESIAAGITHTSIHLTDFAKGIYLLKISGIDFNTNQKLIVE